MSDHEKLAATLEYFGWPECRAAAAVIRAQDVQLNKPPEPGGWVHAQDHMRLLDELATERKATDLIAQERDAFEDALKRERTAREEMEQAYVDRIKRLWGMINANELAATTAESKLARVEAATIERCAKVICIHCRNGEAREDENWHLCKAGRMLCNASSIRALQRTETAAPCALGDSCPDAHKYGDVHPAPAAAPDLPTIGPGMLADLHADYQQKVKAAKIEGMEWAKKACEAMAGGWFLYDGNMRLGKYIAAEIARLREEG
jgi:hypothetical protein